MIKSNSYPLKKWLFGITTFVATFFTEMAFIGATAEFLNAGLIDRLPALLLAVSLIAIVNYSLDVLLSRKTSALTSTLFFLLAVMVFGAVCLYLQWSITVYLFLSLVLARFSSTAFDTSLENLSSGYVNSRQAKSFLPMVRGMMDIAQLLSSVAVVGVTLLDIRINPVWLVMIGTGLFMVCLFLISWQFDAVTGEDTSEQDRQVGLLPGIRQSLSFVFEKSRLFRLMTFVFFLFGGVVVLHFYVYNAAFSINLKGDELVHFIALTSFVAVSIRAVFNLLVSRQVIYGVGVANLLLTYPWIMFVLCFLMVIFPNNLYLAAVLFIFHTFAFYSYVMVSSQAMFGLIPRNLSQQVFFFIKGVIFSLSSLLVSLLIFSLTPFLNDYPGLVVYILLFLMSLSLIFVLKIKREYQAALFWALNDKDAYLRGSSVDLMGEHVQKERGEKLLRKILLNGKETLELRQRALTSLVEIGNPNSIREYLLVLENEKNLRLRYYSIQAINLSFRNMDAKTFGNMNVTKLLMIDVFNKVYLEDLPLSIKLEVNQALKMFGFDVLLDFYKRHFTASTDYIKASIIEALSVTEDRGLITLLEPYLKSDNLAIKAAAIAGLWRFTEMKDRLMNIMIDIFSGKDDQTRMVALKLIGELQLKTMDDYVLDLVAVPNKELATMSVITSISLGRMGGVTVLSRKLQKFIVQGDGKMVEFIFKRFYLLSPRAKKKFLQEIRSLSTANFNQLRALFNQSDAFFDLSLAALFTS